MHARLLPVEMETDLESPYSISINTLGTTIYKIENITSITIRSPKIQEGHWPNLKWEAVNVNLSQWQRLVFVCLWNMATGLTQFADGTSILKYTQCPIKIRDFNSTQPCSETSKCSQWNNHNHWKRVIIAAPATDHRFDRCFHNRVFVSALESHRTIHHQLQMCSAIANSWGTYCIDPKFTLGSVFPQRPRTPSILPLKVN